MCIKDDSKLNFLRKMTKQKQISTRMIFLRLFFLYSIGALVPPRVLKMCFFRDSFALKEMAIKSQNLNFLLKLDHFSFF